MHDLAHDQPGTERTQSLSPAQERLWFLHRFDSEDASFNVHSVYRLRGPLDADAVAAAFTGVAARHESLRTRFPDRGGRPVAVVDPPAPVAVERLDLTGLASEARDAAAARLVAERTGAPFDVATSPPLRVTLLRLADDDHVLCTVLDHLVCDGWSLRVLNRELAGLYAAHTGGTAPDLEPPALQFGDYLRWRQRHPPTGDDLSYWKTQLAGVPALELPIDHPRPAQRRSDGGQVVFQLPEPVTAAATQLARSRRCTLYTVLLAAWQVLLSRHTGQTDIPVGATVAGRDHPRLEPLIGLFTGTLVLRGDLSGDPAFTELLARTRRTLRSAMAHQNVPFEVLLTELDVERGLSRTPLFETMLTLLPSSMSQAETAPVPGVDAALFPHGHTPARFDLTLDLWPDAGGTGGLTAALAYSTSLFDHATAARLADRFVTLLAAAVATPDARLSRLDLLPDGERDQLVAGWNDTRVPVPDATVVELVTRQAGATPDATAVTSGTRRLTYAELLAQATRLAGRLRAAGARPGGLVVVCLERSADLPVALLGVAMTGAAYVPVDPDYPAARIADVLDDSGATVALAHRRLRQLLPDGITVVAVDDPDSPAGDTPAAHGGERSAARPEDTAYVLYTSGSTGRPKGVAVPHAALTNFLEGMRTVLGTTPGEVWLGLTTLSFDISALELFLPLISGGQVVIPDTDTARDGRALARLAREFGMTHVQATPSGWRMLLAGDFDASGLVALTGGEALPPPLARELRARTGRLVNLYGPTETTIWSTAWEVPEAPDTVSIGRPIANTTVQVLDETGGLTPVGVPGELHIGGLGVARGYLGRPALTAERFVPDPFGPPGSRRYRTGDRARWRHDGTLEFLGRTDCQVKVRGFRIELGEIEAVLEAHPAIDHAAVVVRDETLVAYVVGPADAVVPHAAAALPAYMVPAVAVALDALPLTPNGKLDRRALPDPERPAGSGRAPGTPTERLVAGTFAAVVGLDQLHADDDFFAVGGHSLLATMVTARVSDHLGTEIPVRMLFTHPTVAGFAAAVDTAVAARPEVDRAGDTSGDAAEDGAGDAGGRGRLVPLRPRPAGTDPPLAPGQERLWFLHRLDPDDASYNIYLARRLRGPLDQRALGAALTGVVARHESLRTRFPEIDGTPLAVVEPPGEVAVEHLDVTGLPAADRDAETRRLLGGRVNAPFDLAAAPPLRVALVRVADDDHVLCMVMHHVVGDGWSLNVLHHELAHLYEAHLAGTPPTLPPLPVQYGDVALWQRRNEAGPATDALVAWWRERLADPTALELPTDRPRPPVLSRRGAVHDFDIPADVVAALDQTARDRRVTRFMVLLAAWQVLLSRHSGQTDILVGAPAASRDRVELEPLVGYLTNTLVLRGDLAGDPTFTELLIRTRRTALEALTHQGVPFERLLSALDLERDLGRTPLFQAMLVAHAQDPGEGVGGPREQGFAGIGSEPFDAGIQQSKFDLTLNLYQEPGGNLHASFTYSTDLFDPATMARMARRLETLLRAVVAHPQARLSALELLPSDETALVTDRFSRPDPPAVPAATTERPPTADGLLHELVAAQAARTPSATAVVHGQQSLRYADLESRANQLARHLQRHGVGPDDRVGICLEQSTDLAVAVLGVLKAGGAYVPIDPEQPRERTAHMLSDSGARVLVTDAVLRDRAAGFAGTVVCVDADRDAVAAEPTQPVDSCTGPENLAYVIYTSGTTGRPKGVAVQHRQVLTYLRGVQERFEVPPGATYGLLQSVVFDFAVTTFYLSLMSGGCLHLVPARISGADLAAYLRQAGIDVLKMTPSHLASLQAEVDPAALLPRRLLLLGGEASGWDWARTLAGAGTCTVANHYGPTEATVGVTTHHVRADDAPGGPTLPVGRPLPGARVYVLDEHLHPVPVGVAGEIHIGGDRLARGYLGQPGLTAERFVPDPFGDGARLYRTGDLGRWLPDGSLVFLGRRDLQVKVRGYRVEPGEIEAALGGCAGVASAVVDARQDGAGGRRLVAYLVGADGQPEPSVRDLRAHLLDRLPEYMVPARYVWLDRLPLKAHGKVDRERLPEPDGERPDQAVGYVAPATAVEEALAEVWAEVLGLERVGVLDDFFELGGHSLLATRLVARLRKALPEDARPVSVMDLFKRPTVRALAEHVESDAAQEPLRLLHELTRPVPDGQRVLSVVSVPYGGGSAVVYQPLADALPDGCSLYSVAIPGHDLGLTDTDTDTGADDAPRPLEEIAQACAEEVLEQVDGPLVLYGHCGVGGALTVETARRLEAAGRQVDAVYLGGIFPFALPTGRVLGPLARRFRLDGVVGDRTHENWLRGLGADMDGLDDEQMRFIIRNIRRDSRMAEDYFTRLFDQQREPLRAPVISVVGERDPSTEYYQERYREWQFLTDATALVVLDEGGHYFLKYRADELAEIVTGTHVALAAGTCEPVDTADAPPEASWWVGGASTAQAANSPQAPANGSAQKPADGPAARPAAGVRAAGPQPSMGRFLVVALSQLVSITGSTITDFALPLWTYMQTGSLSEFAILLLLGVLPGTLAAPLSGAIVDRSSRRAVMLVSDSVSALMIGMMALLYWTGTLGGWRLYVLIAGLSVAVSFQRLAYLSAVAQLVPKRFLGHANGIAQATTGMAQFVSPLVAVAMLAGIGLGGILLLDLATFAVVATIIGMVKFPRTMAYRRRETLGAEIAGGFRYSLGRRSLRAMVIYFALINTFMAPLLMMLQPLVLSFSTMATAGTIAVAGGGGMLLGGLVVGLWGGPRHRRMFGTLTAAAVMGLFGAFTGLRPHAVVVGVGAFGLFFWLSVVNGIYATIVQVKVPQRLHGRVFALNQMVAWSTLPLGSAVIAPLWVGVFDPMFAPGGALAGSVGALIGVGEGRALGFLYIVFGLVMTAVSIGATAQRTLSSFDDEVPDATPDDLLGVQALQRRHQPAPAARDDTRDDTIDDTRDDTRDDTKDDTREPV